ncbi:MAG: glycosyltransferase family 4 protein [Bacteroidota bacterium]|nr:glycosyltransferase family 4 protein [Bacteroidota bacterium]
MRVLQICHKPPYPHIDGGCIAIKNISQGLIDKFDEIKILTISTQKHPFKKEEFPESFLEKSKIEHVFVDTKLNIVDAFSNLVTYDSYNISRFFSPDFNALLIKSLRAESYDLVILESLFTTPYIQTIRSYSSAKIVLRSHNLEHIIWKRLANETHNPAKKIYLNLLSNQLKKYELNVINDVDGIACISVEDEKKYKSLDYKKPIICIPFGLDIHEYVPEDKKTHEEIKFFHLGAMDWKPNLEGVSWLVENVWPKIKREIPNAELHLAGKNMPNWFLDEKFEGIVNHKEVENAIEFMNSMDIMLVPLFSAGGLRVKIIEGMALSKPIISTSIGAEGIEHNQNIKIANNEDEFIIQAKSLVNDFDYAKKLGQLARIHVSSLYDNEKIVDNLIKFCEHSI